MRNVASFKTLDARDKARVVLIVIRLKHINTVASIWPGGLDGGEIITRLAIIYWGAAGLIVVAIGVRGYSKDNDDKKSSLPTTDWTAVTWRWSSGIALASSNAAVMLLRPHPGKTMEPGSCSKKRITQGDGYIPRLASSSLRYPCIMFPVIGRVCLKSFWMKHEIDIVKKPFTMQINDMLGY